MLRFPNVLAAIALLLLFIAVSGQLEAVSVKVSAARVTMPNGQFDLQIINKSDPNGTVDRTSPEGHPDDIY